jgi:DegV family protein with EDD domain
MRLHIVTDSSALLPHPFHLPSHPLTIVPNRVVMDGKVYLEGVDFTGEEALTRVGLQVLPPLIVPPSSEEFAEAYNQALRSADAVVSLHPSHMLSASWENARNAAQAFGDLKVAVIDTRTTDAALGMVVKAVSKAVQRAGNLENALRLARNAAARTYAIYAVESTEFLMRNHIMTPAHALLSAMNHMMPLITLEEGALLPMEKAKNRSQALERVVEFAIEFENIEDILIVQPKAHLTEQGRTLRERLLEELPYRQIAHAPYSLSLAAKIGVDAVGVIILEANP